MEIKNCKPNDIIVISLEEYKELLTIKGKYEELKSMYYGPSLKTNITYRGPETFKSPYTFTCGESDGLTYTAGYCAVKDFKGDDGEAA